MSTVWARHRRFTVFLGYVVLTFVLYASSEAGTLGAAVEILRLKASLIGLAIATG